MFIPRYQSEQTDLLMRALLALETTEEAQRFLEDVLTVQELRSITQRLEVAVLLRQNLSGDRPPDGRVYRHHQPGEPGPAVRGGRLPAGAGSFAGSVRHTDETS